MRATNFGHSAGMSGDMGLVRIASPTTVIAGRSSVLSMWASCELVEWPVGISTPRIRWNSMQY